MFVKINDPIEYENTNIEGHYQFNNQYKKVSSTYIINIIQLQKLNIIFIISGSCGINIVIQRGSYNCFYIGCFDIINGLVIYKYKISSDQVIASRYESIKHVLKINEIDMFINHIDHINNMKINDILDFINMLPDTFNDMRSVMTELVTGKTAFAGIFQKLTLKPINIHLPTVVV